MCIRDRPNIRLTHPSKILDSTTSLTKQALADYYYAIAPLMLPHIAHRPLSLVRCPEGSAKPCFFQKHVNATLPPGIGAVDVPDKKTGVIEPYITLSTPEALAGLAQMGVLEVHPWGSRNDDLEHPDRLIFDLEDVYKRQLTSRMSGVRVPHCPPLPAFSLPGAPTLVILHLLPPVAHRTEYILTSPP